MQCILKHSAAAFDDAVVLAQVAGQKNKFRKKLPRGPYSIYLVPDKYENLPFDYTLKVWEFSKPLEFLTPYGPTCLTAGVVIFLKGVTV